MIKKNGNDIALILGGTGGIGKSIALRLARGGFDIWLNYRSNHDAAEAIKGEVEGMGRKCELLCFDVSDYDATVAALSERCEANPPFAVIYNAGITRDNLLMWMTKQEWDDVIRTNLDGLFNVSRTVIFSMLAAKRGRIVINSSVSGQVGVPGQFNYSASKAGLIGAGKSLAREVGRKGICVNIVAPGFIETEMTSEVPSDKVLPLIPLNRLGTVEDVAAVVDFLCSEENMYITGQVIGINGGLAT